MKKFIYCLLALLAISGTVTSCSDSDDETKKILLVEGQTEVKTIPANHTSDYIAINALASWSAWTALSPDGAPEDVEWLTLESTHGSAGETTVPFSLLPNNTGAERTVYIIIVCEDSRISIKVTQTAEDDDEWDEPSVEDPFSSMAEMLNHWFPIFNIREFDGNMFTYLSHADTKIVHQIHGDIANCTLDYTQFPEMITAETSIGVVFKITMHHSTPFASHIDVVDNGKVTDSYDFEYRRDCLSKVTHYSNGEFEEMSEIVWSGDRDITHVVTYSESGTMVTEFAYTDIDNSAPLMMLDTQLWLDLDQLEALYYCGIFGAPTSHLIASSTSVETDDEGTYRFHSEYNYTLDGNGCPVKVSYTETEEGHATSTGIATFEWISKYSN